MTLTRRDFLKLGATATAAGAAAVATQQALKDTAYRGPAARASAASGSNEAVVKTACALCPCGCGLEVRVVDGRAVKIEGDPLHPLNQGACCLKGQTALEVLYSPERLPRPRLQAGSRGSGQWREIAWDEALGLLAGKLADLRAAGLGHTVALVHGETQGQMRGLLSRFMAAYGSPNLISTESLDVQAARLASFFTQGVNGLPVYDLNNAGYVLAFGGNLLESSRNVIGALAATAFMRRGRPQRGKLVHVHPRLSLTGAKSDEWVPIRPGTYGALALGLANVIVNSALYDQDFVRDFCFGFEDFADEAGHRHQGFKRLVLEQYTLDRVARITGVPAEVIARLAGEFATNRPAVALLPAEPGGLDGEGLYAAMAIHALNALVGSIDAAGGVLTQHYPAPALWPAFVPDLAAQAGLSQERVDGAGSAGLPLALSAYQNLPDRLLAGRPYPLNVVLSLNANPVYDLAGGRMLEALQDVPFVVSFAPVLDETAAQADLVLPASTFLEAWGDAYLEGTGFAGVTLRRPVVPPVLDARDPGDVLLDLAARLGGPVAEALPWPDYRSLVAFRLGGIDMDWDKFQANGNWSELVYLHARPGSQAWGDVVGRDRLSAPKDGRFDLFSRELCAALPGADDSAYLPHFELAEAAARAAPDADYPFWLVTQAPITQSRGWSGIVPTLQEIVGLQAGHRWSSWVEVSPLAARGLGLRDGDWAWVESEAGRVRAQVRVFAGLWPDAVFMPAGMGHHTLVRWGRGSDTAVVVGSNAAQLAAAGIEALGGQAAGRLTRVRVVKA